MDRKYIDCREMPNEANCTLRISGTEDEVVRAGAEHAASVHGEKDTPEFREQLRGMLKYDNEGLPVGEKNEAVAQAGVQH